MKLLDWDMYFLNLADTIALKSKDESNKIGAIIVGPDHEIRSTGYNGFPRGFDDADPAKQERPIKYKYFEHAERNAIYNAARFGAALKDCTLYCKWPPCSDCARAIIQAGISHCVFRYNWASCPDRWQEDMKIACDMLVQCGVQIKEMEKYD